MKKQKYVKPETEVVEVLVENDVLGPGIGSGNTGTQFSPGRRDDDWEDEPTD